MTIKAVESWELDVLAVPFYGPYGGRDETGEYFSPRTNLHLDKFTSPLVVYYHGFDPDGEPQGNPELIGQAVNYEKRSDGVWWRVVLDKTNEFAKRVWRAAQDGLAKASSGSLEHLIRRAKDGEILNWPLAEISLFDIEGKRRPANSYAVAQPVMKALYAQAGIRMPEISAIELAEDRISAHFDRDPTEEERLYTDAANNLVKAFARGRKGLEPKPVRVRFFDIPAALKRDGQCSVARPDEFRVIATNQKSEARQLEVFFHEVWHAIDSVDPAHWEHLCDGGNQEFHAKKGAEHLAKIARIARKAAERAAGRNQPNPFKTIELETIEALARYSPAWLKEFQKRSWILPY